MIDLVLKRIDLVEKAVKFITDNGFLIVYSPDVILYTLCEKETYRTIGGISFKSPIDAAEWLKLSLDK